MQENENPGSEQWEKVEKPSLPPNPLDTLPKRSKSSSFFIYLNIVLALMVGAVIGFFGFWFSLGPKGEDQAKASSTPITQATEAPSPVASQTPEAAKSTNITVESPRRGDAIKSPVIISGSARVFESAVSIRIKNGTGDVISQQDTGAQGEIGQFNPFSVAVQFPKQTLGTQGTIEVYTHNAQSGSEEDLVQVPVTF